MSAIRVSVLLYQSHERGNCRQAAAVSAETLSLGPEKQGGSGTYAAVRSQQEARRRLELLSDRLLANPVIENWTLELQQA